MRRSVTGTMVVIVALSLIAVTAVASPMDFRPRTKATEQPTAQFDRAGWAMKMDRLNQRLAADHVRLEGERPLEVRVDPTLIEEVVRGHAEERRLKVGVEADVSFSVDFSDLDLRMLSPRATARPIGAIRGTGHGGFVWSAAIRSPEAVAVRVHIKNMDFPEGSELYAWTRDGMAFGPYTGRGPNQTGEFWTEAVQGDEVILQIHHNGQRAPSFRIAGVSHLTSKWRMAATLNPMAAQPACDFNAACVIDAECMTTNSAVNTAKEAVAEMLFASGPYQYICSGGLVADSDSSSEIPYFITANHCISKGREASSLQTFFGFVSGTCGSCPGFPGVSTNGSSIISTNRTSDYSLLQLSQSAPNGAVFLGWDSTEIAFSDGASLYRISHPGGAPQSYSEHEVDTSKGTCTTWPRGNWIYSQDVLGATEGGSSGSPVVNGAGLLVGQLSGGCGTNVYETCDSVNNATVDGAFAAYYDNVAQWLGSGDGGGPCTDGDGDGYCPSEGDCDDNDPSVNPGAVEICDDNKDNDCDGFTDCVDGDCSSAPSCNTGGSCTDADGDGWCVEDGDCDDNNAHVYPGHNDSKGRWGRDGIDNDCNGVVDG